MSHKAPIKSLSIKGFKSIQNLDSFKLNQLNVLIGANGVGKSNFISYFRMLSEMGEEYSWRETAQVIRVHVICEGQTEETFVREVLQEEFALKNIFLLPALLGKPGHKGG